MFIILVLATSVQGFGQRLATHRLRTAFQAYLRAEGQKERRRLTLAVLGDGRPGLAWLKAKKARTPKAKKALGEIEDRAAHLLGEDILAATPKVTPWIWYPNLLQVGEILLLERVDGVLGALRVLADPYPGDGNLAFEWWTPKPKARTFAGAESGRGRAAGKESSPPWRPQSGWTEFDYRLEFKGFRADVRFVGPLHLLIRLDGTTAVALPGSRSVKSVSLAGARAPRFLATAPSSWLRVEGDLQTYLFRLLPGCSPLRLKPGEKKSFSHFESVQVKLRLQRGAGGFPLVLVHILEPTQAGLLPEHLPLIRRFLGALVPEAASHLLIMGGDAPAMEGNRFFGPGGWGPPSATQIQTLRREFSEES